MKKVKATVHPEALAALRKYRGDIKAGHLDAAEYWRGQAGAYFTANPYDYDAIRRDMQELWRKACIHDGMPLDTKFAVFSPDNPYIEQYNETMQKYWKLQSFRHGQHGQEKNPSRYGGPGMWEPQTYIYIRPEDGKCVHVNAVGSVIGKEYEHDNKNWMPPADWPYRIKDLRKEKNPGVMPFPWLPAAAQQKFLTTRNPREKYVLRRNLWELLGPGIIGGVGWGAGYGLWRYLSSQTFGPAHPMTKGNPIHVRGARCYKCGRLIIIFPWEKTPICVDCAKKIRRNPFFADLGTGLALGTGWTAAMLGVKYAIKAFQERKKKR